ncbi:MAG: hypothetical protein JXM69_04700 [Anaerolineae bacterium]|nr:hypothetical protein [Anaerolineae bacterium]
MNDQELTKHIDTTLYFNRWIAVVRGRVVGVGLNSQQAHRAATQTRPKDKPQLFYVDTEGKLTRSEAKDLPKNVET